MDVRIRNCILTMTRAAGELSAGVEDPGTGPVLGCLVRAIQNEIISYVCMNVLNGNAHVYSVATLVKNYITSREYHSDYAEGALEALQSYLDTLR